MAKEELTPLENDLKKYGPTLTPEEVAEILQLSRKTVDEYIKNGTINAFPLDPTKERKQYRVSKSALIEYMTTKEK